MDEADMAQELMEMRLAQAISRAVSPKTRESLDECEDCGEPIPEARRLAVPGCTRCVKCQADFEREK